MLLSVWLRDDPNSSGLTFEAGVIWWVVVFIDGVAAPTTEARHSGLSIFNW